MPYKELILFAFKLKHFNGEAALFKLKIPGCAN
jgi:hypothetical protein